MKKVFVIALTVLLCVFVLLPLAVFAEDSAEDALVEQPEESENTTFFGRIGEYLEGNLSTVLVVAGFCATGSIDYLRNKRINSDNAKASTELVNTGKNVLQMLSASNGLVNSNNNVIDVINSLINSNNTMEQKYTLFGESEANVEKLMKANLSASMAVMQMLATVYPNSNLPTGAKDMVQLIYAKAMKDIQYDDVSVSEEVTNTEVA